MQSSRNKNILVITGVFISILVALIFLYLFFTRQNDTENTKKEKKNLLDKNLCNGFDFPIGNVNGQGNYTDPATGKTFNGWYVATSMGELYDLGIHTGEDWNGKGGGNTDLGQPVYATASGRVIEAKDYGAPWGNVVYLEHHYQENGTLKKVFSLYAHLNELKAKKGDHVKRRQLIGTIGDGHNSFPAHLHFEIRTSLMENKPVTYWPSSDNKNVGWVKKNYFSPSTFINDHRQITVPSAAPHVLLAIKHEYKMYYYQSGTLINTFDIALSQESKGAKQIQGDNKMPEGEYRIIQKSRGPFGGSVSEYFGPAWMRLNYPNNFDAERGLRANLISPELYHSIVKANEKHSEPNKNTKLGGGIGIHGWKGDWPLNFRDLTWGCISMKNQELDELYDKLPLGTTVIIVP